MNDFDFEELDKAVSSLAPKAEQEQHVIAVSQPQAAASPSAAPTPPQPSTPAPKSTPLSVQHPDGPVPITSSHQSTRLSDVRPAQRRAFMDIKPPSPQGSGTRVGVRIQPINKPEEVMPQPKSEPAPVVSEPAQPPAQLPEPVQPVEQTISVSPSPTSPNEVKWPDPLDFADTTFTPPDQQPTAQRLSESTPFLPETQVQIEKRPLGAFSHYRSEVPSPPADASDELTPQSDGTFREPDNPAAIEPPKAEPVVEEQNSSSDLHNTAMMSIPQQYRTEEKTADTTTRPVFDTKEYHPPLLEATSPSLRKKSWIGWVVLLVLLSVLGVAGYWVCQYVVQH